MMKLSGGKMTTFGGTFCIQIPCDVDVDCVINPAVLLTFFRKDRTKVTYAVTGNRMVVKQGREKVSIPCMESEKMPIIDVFREHSPVSNFLKPKALKAMLECINPSESRGCLQGLCIQGGLAVATDGKVVLAMLSGLPKKVDCVLPVDTVKLLSTLDESPSGVACESGNIKFVFPSGMTVCSRTILSDGYPNVKTVINATGEVLDMHPDLTEELKGIKCDTITVTEKGIGYRAEDGVSFGEIELPTPGRFSFSADKKLFDLLMSLTKDSRIFITSFPAAIHADGGKFFKMTLAQKQLKA
jgi:hypothetical protein